MSKKSESLERINLISKTNASFVSCNSCKRLGLNNLYELHEAILSFISLSEFTRSKPSFLVVHITGVSEILYKTVLERYLPRISAAYYNPCTWRNWPLLQSRSGALQNDCWLRHCHTGGSSPEAIGGGAAPGEGSADHLAYSPSTT